jgi:hypothetical protein
MGISYKPVEQHLLVLCEYFGDGSFGFKKKKKNNQLGRIFFHVNSHLPSLISATLQRRGGLENPGGNKEKQGRSGRQS